MINPILRPSLLLVLLVTACGPKTPPQSAVPASLTPAPPSVTAPVAVEAPPPVPVVDHHAETVKKANEAVGLLTSASVENARQAIPMLLELRNAHPKLATIPYNLGIAYEASGETGKAEAEYRQSTMLDPAFAPAWLHLGALAERRGQLPEALQYYRMGIERAPQDTDLRVAQVAILIKTRRLDEAIAASRQALQVNSNALNIYANLGIAYIEQNKLDLAKFIFLRALNSVEGAQNNAHIHAYLGRIYYLEKYMADSRKELELSLKLDPNHVPALVYLSEIYLDNRAFTEMVPLLERARLAEPDNIAVHMNLGIAYRGVGRFEEAIKEYETVLRLDPTRTEPYLNQAILFGDYQKKYKESVAALERYKAAGGTKIELVDTWLADIVKEQERAEKLDKRKKEAEEREQKREEERKFLEEFQRKQEEDQRKQKEEEERLLREGGAPTSPAPAGAEGATSSPTPGTESAPITPPPASTEPVPGVPPATPPTDPAAGQPWSTETTATPPATPPAEQPSTTEPTPWGTGNP